MPAKRVITRGLSDVQSHRALEPLPLRVDQADHRQRRPADFRGEEAHVIVGDLGQCIEDIIIAQRLNPLRFVQWQFGFHDRMVSQMRDNSSTGPANATAISAQMNSDGETIQNGKFRVIKDSIVCAFHARYPFTPP